MGHTVRTPQTDRYRQTLPRARWDTPGARWDTSRARWDTPRARWDTPRARWDTPRGRRDRHLVGTHQEHWRHTGTQRGQVGHMVGTPETDRRRQTTRSTLGHTKGTLGHTKGTLGHTNRHRDTGRPSWRHGRRQTSHHLERTDTDRHYQEHVGTHEGRVGIHEGHRWDTPTGTVGHSGHMVGTPETARRRQTLPGARWDTPGARWDTPTGTVGHREAS